MFYCMLSLCYSMAPYFCDLDGEVLSLYGVDSLGELDKNWGVQTTAAVITITFHFMYFDTVADNLYKVKAKFPGVMVSLLLYELAAIFSVI